MSKSGNMLSMTDGLIILTVWINNLSPYRLITFRPFIPISLFLVISCISLFYCLSLHFLSDIDASQANIIKGISHWAESCLIKAGWGVRNVHIVKREGQNVYTSFVSLFIRR